MFKYLLESISREHKQQTTFIFGAVGATTWSVWRSNYHSTTTQPTSEEPQGGYSRLTNGSGVGKGWGLSWARDNNSHHLPTDQSKRPIRETHRFFVVYYNYFKFSNISSNFNNFVPKVIFLYYLQSKKVTYKQVLNFNLRNVDNGF